MPGHDFRMSNRLYRSRRGSLYTGKTKVNYKRAIRGKSYIEFKTSWQERFYEFKPTGSGIVVRWRRGLGASTEVGGQRHRSSNRRAELRPEAVAGSRLHLDSVYGQGLFFGLVG